MSGGDKLMLVSINDDFDLNKIAESGQCFRTKAFEDNAFRFISANNKQVKKRRHVRLASLIMRL